MSKDDKKYDSDSGWFMKGARLCKDPEVREGANGKMVRLTFVSTSRRDGNSDLWIECNVQDFQTDLASYLLKGDVLHYVEGKDFLRKYGENDEKFSFGIDRARLSVPLDLFATLKERGWTPGGGKEEKPAAKKSATKTRAPRKQVELPDD
jgi:single-stranded DNA-binding protein